jgi:hypothetical protein
MWQRFAIRIAAVFAVALLALMLGGRYYAWLAYRAPEEPFPVTALYRPGGDPQYYLLVAGLANLNFGDVETDGRVGDGVSSFPVVTIGIHAAAMKAFGPRGLIVADVAVSGLFLAALYAFFRLFRRERGRAAALAAAALVGSGLVVWAAGGLSRFGVLGPASLPEIWGERFPRPFVTDLLLIIAFVSIAALLHDGGVTAAPRAWALTGAALGLLVHGEIFGLAPLGVLTAAVGLTLCWQCRDRRCLLALAACAGGFAVVVAPFVIQRLFEHPDVPRRYGVFPLVWATVAGDWPDGGRLLRVLAVVVIAAVTVGACRHRSAVRGRLALAAGWCVCAFFGLQLHTLTLRSGVQIDQFAERFPRIASYVVCAGLFVLAQRVADVFSSSVAAGFSPRTRWLKPAATGLVLVVALIFALYEAAHARGQWLRQGYVTSKGRYQRFAPTYRHDLAELVAELRHPEYAERRTILTFDHLAHVCSVVFLGKTVTCPDAFATPLPDAEIELRMIFACKGCLGLTGEQFLHFLDDRTVLGNWLAVYKYQYSKYYRYSNLPEDYDGPPPTAVDASRNFVLPKSECERLASAYAVAADEPDRFRCDLLILNRPDVEAYGFRPDPQRFTPGFRNASFEVWLRRTDDSTIARSGR